MQKFTQWCFDHDQKWIIWLMIVVGFLPLLVVYIVGGLFQSVIALWSDVTQIAYILNNTNKEDF